MITKYPLLFPIVRIEYVRYKLIIFPRIKISPLLYIVLNSKI